MSAPRLSAVLLALGLAACDPVGGEPPDVQVCEALPKGKVQPVLDPIADGRAIDTVTPSLQMCSYRIPQVDQLQQVRVLVDYTYFGTSAEANAALYSARTEAEGRGLANVASVSGLGDDAFISQEGETVGIKVHRGRLLMQVNVGKYGASFDTLAPVVETLTARALAVMPALD